MSINLTDEIEVKTKKGKLGSAKQIFLEGDTQTVEKEIQDINSRHNDLNSKHESLSSTVSEHTNQIESNQSQITANKSAQDAKNASLDANMAKLNTRDDQITELVRGITATGGASVATAVTYDNTSSQLTSATVQGAVDELQESKINKKSILQESGNAKDKVMSQKAISTELNKKANVTDVDNISRLKLSNINIYTNAVLTGNIETLTSEDRGLFSLKEGQPVIINLGYRFLIDGIDLNSVNNRPFYVEIDIESRFDSNFTNCVLLDKNDNIINTCPILINNTAVVAIPKGYKLKLVSKTNTIKISRSIILKDYTEEFNYINAINKHQDTAIQGVIESVGKKNTITPTWTSGKFVDYKTGTIQDYKYYAYTDFISVDYNRIIRTNAFDGGNAGYALYDINKNYISGGQLGATALEKELSITNINACYIRISNFFTSLSTSACYIITESDNFNNSITHSINSNIRSINNITTELNKTNKKLDNTLVTFSECPIVTFVYDDGPAVDDEIVELMDKRNLKASFALMGNKNPEAKEWKDIVDRYSSYINKGHDVLVHGIATGVSVTIRDNSNYNGLGHINDEDTISTLESTIASFKKYNLPVNGFVNFNGGRIENPHVRSILGRYFDFVVDWDKKGGLNFANEDGYYISRYITDSKNMLEGAKKLIDNNIGKNCLIVFGGHAATIGKEGKVSKNDFILLLDYIADKVNKGLIISQNCRKGVQTLYSRGISNTVIRTLDNSGYNPMKGQLNIIDNSVKICTFPGNKSIYSMELSGTPTNGAIEITLDCLNFNQTINIPTTVTDSIEAIIDKFTTNIAYKAYTLVKESNTKILFYCDKCVETNLIEINSNTSNLTININTIQNGKSPTFV